MAQQIIGVGTGPDSHNGEPLRAAWVKTNSNFTELYNTVANLTADSNGNLLLTGQTIAGTINNADIVIDPLGAGKLQVAANLVTPFLNFYGPRISTSVTGNLELAASSGNIKLNKIGRAHV